jgi:hypothetical protein
MSKRNEKERRVKKRDEESVSGMSNEKIRKLGTSKRNEKDANKSVENNW